MYNTAAKRTETSLIKFAAVLCVVSVVFFILFLFRINSNFVSARVDGLYTITQVHAVINRERIARGIEPLILNERLINAAQNKAEDMRDKNYFSHISPIDGREWKEFIADSGYTYQEAGENLANGYDQVGQMVEAWLKSPSHKENMLNPNVNETGFGITYGQLEDSETIYVVQLFGKPAQELQNTVELIE